jgi:hypothetical protein
VDGGAEGHVGDGVSAGVVSADADRDAGVGCDVVEDGLPGSGAERGVWVLAGVSPGGDGVEVAPQGAFASRHGAQEGDAMPAGVGGGVAAGGPVECGGVVVVVAEAHAAAEFVEGDVGELAELRVGHAHGHAGAALVDGGFGDGAAAEVLVAAVAVAAAEV